jgi:hypothetical protein
MAPQNTEKFKDAPETIKNHERGCGHLDADSTYLRIDPELIREGGELPLFVEFKTPELLQNEHHRNLFQGMSGTDWLRKYQEYLNPDPEGELEKHDQRLREAEPSYQHAGHDPLTYASDIIMWVGVSYYPDPQDFIEEAKTMGANKKLPKGNTPKISQGTTRCFIIHPHAIPPQNPEEYDEEDDEYAGYRPGVIGYFYPNRVVHTKNEDGTVSKKIKEKAEAGKLDIVERGQEISEEEDIHGDIEEFSTRGDEE